MVCWGICLDVESLMLFVTYSMWDGAYGGYGTRLRLQVLMDRLAYV